MSVYQSTTISLKNTDLSGNEKLKGDIEVAYECVVKCLKEQIKDITDTVHR